MKATQSAVKPASAPRMLAEVLPAEGGAYFSRLQQLRFARHAHARLTFLQPAGLSELLTAAIAARGDLQGDDRRVMQMGGLPSSAFPLEAERYQYLRAPAEGRVGIMNIHELPEWVPVTVQATSETTPDPAVKHHLSFAVDADFQRHVNYATIIIAPNWFDDPSTEHAVLDVFPGPPPHGVHSLHKQHKAVVELGLEPGHQTTVGALRERISSEDGNLLMGCCLRNLPGS